jgi:hypothetical protein
MHLIYRPARITDFPACLACTRELFAFAPPQQKQLLQMWRELLAGGAVNFWVMEDLEGQPGETLAYFCLVAFVTEEFAAGMKTTLPPYVARQALEWWAAGNSPFLDLPALRRANTDGELHLVCLQSGFHFDTAKHKSEEGKEVRDKIPDLVILTGSGYQVRECFFEAYGGWECQWAISAGFGLCEDHAEFYATEGTRVPPEQRACLFSLSREEAARREGAITATVFTYRPPRFCLTPGEQEMLQWALTGLTDEELATELSLATVTVSKRWARIYGHVQDIAPEMFPAEARPGAKGRGPEKRRRLLHYLRHHLEELRPHLRTAQRR